MGTGWNYGVVEVAGVEAPTPNCLQYNDIIGYNQTAKIVNGTGVMGQFALIIVFLQLLKISILIQESR